MPEPDITALMQAAGQGEVASRERLLALIYRDLLRLARAKLAHERTYTDLNASALVHEAYLRFAPRMPADVASRRVFYAYAARAMESVIVDHVRRRASAKRGEGRVEVTLATGVEGEEERCDDTRLDALGSALRQLERIDAGLHEIVQLRYFAGLPVEQIAELLGHSPATVKRRWSQAREILKHAVAHTG